MEDRIAYKSSRAIRETRDVMGKYRYSIHVPPAFHYKSFLQETSSSFLKFNTKIFLLERSPFFFYEFSRKIDPRILLRVVQQIIQTKEKESISKKNRLIIVNFSHANLTRRKREREKKKNIKKSIRHLSLARGVTDPLSPGIIGRRYLNCNACLVHDFFHRATLSPAYLHVAHDE